MTPFEYIGNILSEKTGYIKRKFFPVFLPDLNLGLDLFCI